MSGTTSFDPTRATATDIARAVAQGAISARDVVDATLTAIARINPKINAFTQVTAARARAKAAAIDADRGRGAALGPLAGVPYAVKNLFDIEGVVTTAGSKIQRDDGAATADAPLIERLEAAGAILCGALNMGEYAYDFTGDNLHDGAALNPHDLRHMTGGSSSGSAAAVAAGLVPFALGSDTNGSIRVPASFCGLFGLKPTFGRLPRRGTFPFVASFDHLGPLGRSVGDLALAYDAMQGPDPRDAACAQRGVEPVSERLEKGRDGLRIGVATGYFAKGGMPACFAAVAQVAAALDARMEIELAEAARARSAAYIITASEGGALHLDRLRRRPQDFDAEVRHRLFAGAMIPASLVMQAQKFRSWYRRHVLAAFETVDIILAPAAPCPAPRRGQERMLLDGVDSSVRAKYRHIHATHFLHRPAGLRRAGLDEGRGTADGRAGDRRTVARRSRVARRA